MSLTVRSALPRRPLQRHGLKLTMLATCGALLTLPVCSALADKDGGGPMVVTTDSRDYCRTLSSAIERHKSLPVEVRELKAEGDGLCREGRIRGGITRLRRALLVLNETTRVRH